MSTRPYITEKFRRNVFSNLHGLGHRATKPLINTRFVWHGMNIDIAKWCHSCKGCQTAKISRHNKPVFGKFTEPTERFDHLHIDIPCRTLTVLDIFRYLRRSFHTLAGSRSSCKYSSHNSCRCLLQWVDSTFWDTRHYHHR